MTAIVGAGAYWTPTPPDTAVEYVPTAEAILAMHTELARIDELHAATAQRCARCGQLTYRLDDFGLCSKVSTPHVQWREQVLRQENGTPRKRRRRGAASTPPRAVTS